LLEIPYHLSELPLQTILEAADDVYLLVASALWEREKGVTIQNE